MSLGQLLAVLRARAGLIFLLVLAVILAVMAGSLAMTPRYTASAQVLLDIGTPDPVAGSALPAHLVASHFATQVELIASERVALKVVDELALEEKAGWQLRPGTLFAASQLERRRRLARSLLAGLKVRPARDSNLLVVSYTSADRYSVAAVANAFVHAYVDTIVEMRRQPAAETREFFAEQTRQYREALQQAQARLTAFRSSQGIATADEASDVEMLRMQALASQMTSLQSAREEAQRRRDAAEVALRTGSADLAEMLGNPLVQSIKADLTRAQARLRERSSVLGVNHPEIGMLREEVAALEGRLVTETAAIAGSLDRDLQVALQREAQLRVQLERQREAVMGNRSARERIEALQRDVDQARRAYDALAERLTRSSLESQANQANALPLVSASVPTRPSSPDLVLNLAAALVFGSLLGVGGALGLESVSARIRDAVSLEQASSAATLGSLGHAPVSWVKRSRRRYGRRREPRLVLVAREASSAPATVSTASSGLTGSSGSSGSTGSTGSALEIPAPGAIEGALLDPVSSEVAPEVVAAFSSDHRFLDELRTLRTRLRAAMNRTAGESSRVLAVVSPAQGEGKSFTASNLAVSFAQMGERTLLIDGDLRSGRLHELFALPATLGLTSVLQMHCTAQQAVQPVPGLAGLSLLAAGPGVDRPTDLLARDATAFLIQGLAQAFDIVIIDTPPAQQRPDAALLVSASRQYLLVARENLTGRAGVVRLAHELDQLGARLLGSVLLRR